MSLKLTYCLFYVLIALLFGCKPNDQVQQNDLGLVNELVSTGIQKLDSGQFQEAEQIFKSIDTSLLNEISLATWSNGMGTYHYKFEQFPQAIQYFASAKLDFKALNMSKEEASCEFNVANCFKSLGLYDKSVMHAKNAEKFFAKGEENLEYLVLIYNLMGNVFTETGAYYLALNYHRKSLETRLQIGTSTAPAMNNVGNAYFEMKNYDSALFYFMAYKDLSKEEDNIRKLGRAHENIAKTFVQTGEKEQAHKNLDSARIYYQQDNFQLGLASADLIEARLIKTDRPDEALRLIKKALGIRISNLALQLEMYAELESIANLLDMKALAYETTKRHQELKDSIKGQKVISKILTDEMFSRLETKDQEIRRITKQKTLEANARRTNAFQRNAFILVSLLLGLLGFVWFKRFKEKQKFVDEYFSVGEEQLVLKSGEMLEFNNIVRVETYRNDVIFYTRLGKVVEKRTTLKEVLESGILPKIQFNQIQHGIVVNFDFVTKVLKTKIIVEQVEIKLSPKFKEEVLQNWEIYQSTKSKLHY